ncbi:transporter substrate-binding domain-containing protein [Pseudomonas sp. LP_7_YM]|uniref:transporter substrate-binding domain-containing protein n=1 Tax=Pseudomonas sp. LP_7_YM TaxID=2485137 RepID=UPI00106056F0|nr:transporter substrate-binding domain-containing protein [Pseudomonas sp. LP_7_YM]TDV59721.1 amino acid ABC transporter substrate-binding protein (PAAT family) [Pseudomonas sp. LP_7_YM]
MLDLSKKTVVMLKRGVLAVTLATCCTSVLAAASRDSLIVGVEATYPPMSYRDPATNKSVGFNIDLFEALGNAMKVRVKLEEMSFEQLTSSLSTGRIDVIGTAITDLAKRRTDMTFVDYLQTGAQMFTSIKNTGAGSTPESFCGKAIGTPRTTNYYPEVMAWNDSNCVKAGKAAATIQGTAGASASRLDLQQDRLAAVVLGPEYVKYLMSQEPNTYVLIGQPLSTHHFGFAVAKHNSEVRDELTKGLQILINDGTYQAILKKWNLESQAISQVMVDGGQ